MKHLEKERNNYTRQGKFVKRELLDVEKLAYFKKTKKFLIEEEVGRRPLLHTNTTFVFNRDGFAKGSLPYAFNSNLLTFLYFSKS